MLFNEPKLLKSLLIVWPPYADPSFSALQRAEIAEMGRGVADTATALGFSALQRAEIAEIEHLQRQRHRVHRFSALQRAEIAEMPSR